MPKLKFSTAAIIDRQLSRQKIRQKISVIKTNSFDDIKKIVHVGTLHTADILSGKNARAWVSMVLYLKKKIRIKMLKRKKNPGSPLEVAC